MVPVGTSTSELVNEELNVPNTEDKSTLYFLLYIVDTQDNVKYELDHLTQLYFLTIIITYGVYVVTFMYKM